MWRRSTGRGTSDASFSARRRGRHGQPGRDDPCPCGSATGIRSAARRRRGRVLGVAGPAKTREELTEDAAGAPSRICRGPRAETAIAARRGMSADNLQRYDESMDASDAVVDPSARPARRRTGRGPRSPGPLPRPARRLGPPRHGYEARGENQRRPKRPQGDRVHSSAPRRPSTRPPGPVATLVDRLDPPPARS